MRFIDTSFYAIAAHEGGYDFRTSTTAIQDTLPEESPSAADAPIL